MEKTGQAGRSARLAPLAVCAAVLIAVCALAFGVPVISTAEKRPSGASQTLADAARIDVNTAELEALCLLPGVGESKAGAIIAYREANGAFASLADVAKVKGISEKMVASWAGLATAER